jgi:hypothetical protein
MGQYAYLINKEKRIRCEAHKISGGGNDSLQIETPKLLSEFMEYCRQNNLLIECVSEHWFDNINYETEQPFIDFVCGG